MSEDAHGELPSALPKEGNTMTDAATLLALAERCEEATGPDQSRLLNEAFELIHGDQAHYNALTAAEDRHAYLNLLSKLHRCLGAGAYLDAAMTLVPEGWWLELEQHTTCWTAALADKLWFDDDYEGRTAVDSDGPTPALALCAAALRAQAAQLEKPHD